MKKSKQSKQRERRQMKLQRAKAKSKRCNQERQDTEPNGRQDMNYVGEIERDIQAMEGALRTRGRDSLFEAMRDGYWSIPVFRREVVIKLLNYKQVEDVCRPLSDADMAVYVVFLCCQLAGCLLDRHGEALFSKPGQSQYSLLLSEVATFREAKDFLGELSKAWGRNLSTVAFI